MNTVIVIHTYITSNAIEEMVYKNILQLKKFNLPILITSNFLSERIQKIIDHCYIYKENLLFKRNYENYLYVNHYFYGQDFQINSYHADKQPHGLAVMYALHKGIQLANILGYEYVIRVEWDNFFDDDDINLFKTFHQKIISNKNKEALLFTHKHEYYGETVYIFGILIFKTKFFLENFPYFPNEDSYVKYISEKKVVKFLIFEKLLHMCLVENHEEKIYIYNHIDSLKLSGKNTILNQECTCLNWPSPSTTTTTKLICKINNDKNKFVIFSKNKSYINVENPNWQTINYKINTQKKNLDFVHYVNSNAYQYDFVEIFDDEFPIKITADSVEVIYNNRDEIPNTLKYFT